MKPYASLAVRICVLAATFAVAGGARAQDGITVYNAQHASLTQAWADGFTKETGIKVTLRKGSDTELANQIVQEGAASPADVFVTENSPAMVLVEKAGLFAQLPKDILDQVPARFRPASGRWTGVAARSTVFAYDKRKLKEADLPGSMLDLADAKWKGRWAASPSGADFQAIVGALLVLKGEPTTAGWLKAMKANSSAYRGNSVAMKAVNAGEVEGAVIYHYYYFGDQAKTGENSGNVGLHYFRGRIPAPSSAPPARACWSPASTRSRPRPS
ncbi:iron(III) transport system substrate-binding protein [Bosea sp. TND4EK4]|nr:iron(III) transport system substrate-binding protein [Bosea sp. TND4EK4]